MYLRRNQYKKKKKKNHNKPENKRVWLLTTHGNSSYILRNVVWRLDIIVVVCVCSSPSALSYLMSIAIKAASGLFTKAHHSNMSTMLMQEAECLFLCLFVWPFYFIFAVSEQDIRQL